MAEETETTSCFTYKVEMVIQMLASDEKTARDNLNKNGGYVTKRTVTLVDSVSLFSGDDNGDM
jgi:hypothetical protein